MQFLEFLFCPLVNPSRLQKGQRKPTTPPAARALRSTQVPHSSPRALQLSIAGAAASEGRGESLNRRTMALWRQNPSAEGKVVSFRGVPCQFGTSLVLGAQLICSAQRFHANTVRSGLPAQPTSRASRARQRRTCSHQSKTNSAFHSHMATCCNLDGFHFSLLESVLLGCGAVFLPQVFGTLYCHSGGRCKCDLSGVLVLTTALWLKQCVHVFLFGRKNPAKLRRPEIMFRQFFALGQC